MKFVKVCEIWHPHQSRLIMSFTKNVSDLLTRQSEECFVTVSTISEYEYAPSFYRHSRSHQDNNLYSLP